MTETQESLEARKRDLFAAIRTLDSDYEDGTLDEAAYRSTRERYEREAADILAQLDTLSASARPVTPPPRNRRRLTTWFVIGVIFAALAAILLGAVQRQSENVSLAQTAQSATPQPTSKALQKARAAVLEHPRSETAQIALGNAYLNLGQTALADERFRLAMRLAPSDPRPATLHAMVLGARSNRAPALALLATVEQQHPSYARAWLLDGLLASHNRATDPRAIHAWRRFLKLQPGSSLAPTVRKWIAATKKAEKTAR
jgi:cytochrome c-type biogenesis protein CcmH/NrfG